MQEEPYAEQVYTPPPAQSGFMAFIQRPRILLIMLGVWSILGFLSQVVLNNGIFVESHNEGDVALDGVLGGMALSWQGIALAVLFFYCARDPERYRPVFWLALVALGVSIAANLYHWLLLDTYSFESVAIPLAVAGGLATLVLVHLMAENEEHLATGQATNVTGSG
jgi:hypothetical protein